MYQRAGINNIKGFYADKFVDKTTYNFFNIPLAQFNITYAKYFWILRNVKPHSSVLDFGCGSGTLSILKEIGCKLTGIDLSPKALDIAKNVNNYDSIFCGSIFDFDHSAENFDYIVSLDVFGHIPFEEKDATILELKKHLHPNGVMLHGIECGTIYYDRMSEEELKTFVEIDGHVGIESKAMILTRFGRFFKYVDGEVRFNIENSAEEYIKQADLYDAPHDSELLEYIKSLDSKERLAFDIANGLIQMKMNQMKIASRDDVGGFLYLRASDIPLIDPFGGKIEKKHIKFASALVDDEVFLHGWYDVEMNTFRWSDGNATIFVNFPAQAKSLEIELMGSPKVTKAHPQEVTFLADGKEIACLRIERPGWQVFNIKLKKPAVGKTNVSVRSTTFCPKEEGMSDDSRNLGIALKFIDII